MVESYFDDINYFKPTESIGLVKEFFRINFKKFTLKNDGSYTGNWWVEFEDKVQNITINFDGDIGGSFSIKIVIEDKKFFLWQFDKRVNNATKSNEKNILFQLNTLKRFLLEDNIE